MWNSENVSPQRGRAAARELRRLAARPPPGIKLLLREDDLTDITALIDGPADTPYEGGVFRVRLALGRSFPEAPPRAWFLTRIFHPNVGRGGEVCVSTLARDWRPELGLEHALLALRCLLIAPNAESALNEDAAALLRGRYDDYFARAKLLTDIHARPSAQPQKPAQEDNSTIIAGEASTDTPTGEESDKTVTEAAEGGGAIPEGGASTEGEGAGGPRAKRERRPRDSLKPTPARDKRRILKRL